MNVYLNIKMENNSSGKKKKGVSWVVDKFLNLFLIACGVVDAFLIFGMLLKGKKSRFPVCRDWERYGGMMCWFLIFPIPHNGTV